MKYIARKDTWFKEGTECLKQESLGIDGCSMYSGTYIVGSCNKDGYDKFWYSKGYKDNDKVVMNEHCSNDEFNIIS